MPLVLEAVSINSDLKKLIHSQELQSLPLLRFEPIQYDQNQQQFNAKARRINKNNTYLTLSLFYFLFYLLNCLAFGFEAANHFCDGFHSFGILINYRKNNSLTDNLPSFDSI